MTTLALILAIGLSGISTAAQPQIGESQIALSDGTPARFVQNLTLSDAASPGDILSLSFGTPTRRVDGCVDRIWSRINQGEVGFRQGISGAKLANRLRKVADEELMRTVPTPKLLFRQWAYAEVVCAWMSSFCYYDNALRSTPFEVQRAKADPNATLNMRWPTASCSGKAMLTRDLVRLVAKGTGLKCWYVGGWRRDIGHRAPESSNHSWVLFEFEGGLHLPADVTASGITREEASARRTKYARQWILPTQLDTLELFLAQSFGYIKRDDDVYSRIDQNVASDSIQRIPFPDWAKAKTSYLRQLEEQYRQS